MSNIEESGQAHLPIEVGFNREAPYNALPDLVASEKLETARVLKQLSSARGALGELKGFGQIIPNQEVLVQAIALQEAKHSSAIENIHTTDEKLYQRFSGATSKSDSSTERVLKYRGAMDAGLAALESGKPLSESVFVDIVRQIRGADIGIRDGTVAIESDLTRELIYTPPQGRDRIIGLLRNLAEYWGEDESGVDPLVKMAVMHYQFEAIHPFTDGNGRAGRVLNVLCLIDSDLLTLPVIYLSWYIFRTKDEYQRGLRRVTEEGAWDDWLVYMLKAVEEASKKSLQVIKDIKSEFESAVINAREQMGSRYSKELIELVFQQPITRIAHVERAGIAKRATATAYLKELAACGLLTPIKQGRNILYFNLPLLEILSE